MNNNRILRQFHAMFGVFMVVFYFGTGLFLLFLADRVFTIDKAIRVIMGSTFILYGFYRAYITFKQIVSSFFHSEEQDEQ
jgi:hypothetical protein